jgi:hypothetical protein
MVEARSSGGASDEKSKIPIHTLVSTAVAWARDAEGIDVSAGSGFHEARLDYQVNLALTT